MTTKVGQRLGERYRLVEQIAVGGMGEVWRGIDEMLDRDVAVKVLRAELAADHPLRRRFRAEARTSAMLAHGGIAAVYDFGEAGDLAYLVMELVPGEPLSALLAREGAIGTDRTLSVVAQTARALHAAHCSGVVHRDVKPANILVTPDGQVKVTDFGIARPRDHEPLTATGQVMGTAHYLAPEVARGEVATPQSDVYGLGVVMYECLAGWRPFDGDDQIAVATAHLREQPPPLSETVPADVRAVVGLLMDKDPARRPPGAAAVADLAETLVAQRRGAAITEPLEVFLAPSVRPGTSPAGRGPGRAPGATTGPAARSASPGSPPGRHRPAWPGDPGTAELPAVARYTWVKGPNWRRTRGRWWLLRRGRTRGPLLALLGLVTLVVVGALLTGGSNAGSGAPSSSASPGSASKTAAPTPATHRPSASRTTSRAPSTSRRAAPTGTTPPSAVTVQIRPGDYVGRQIGVVRRELRALGMTVVVRTGVHQVRKGTVLTVEPNGPVVPGSTVTVFVSAGPRKGG